jgi:hypothetical protein
MLKNIYLALILMIVLTCFSNGHNLNQVQSELESHSEIATSDTSRNLKLLKTLVNESNDHFRQKRFSFFSRLFKSVPKENTFLMIKKNGYIIYVPFMIDIKPTF